MPSWYSTAGTGRSIGSCGIAYKRQVPRISSCRTPSLVLSVLRTSLIYPLLQADWKDVILPAPLKSSVRHEYRSFFSSERIYKDLDVAWKRGVIFLGPPGNGKTISVKAMMRDVANGEGVGKETKRVLYVRSFHSEFSTRPRCQT
jgi:hypothetical protein